MENETLKEIIEFATRKLKAAYGYCGVAEGSNAAMINSDDNSGNDIKITIEVIPE